MKMIKITKNKVLIVGLVLVAIVGYYIFQSNSAPAQPLTTTETAATSVVGQELILELNRLRALQNIGQDLFKDPAFVSLQDFTQVVVPQPLGRPNPFAPVGGGI